jgi:flagellar protein FliL
VTMITNDEPVGEGRPGARPEPSLPMWLGIMGALTACAVAAGSIIGILLGGTLPKNGPGAAKPAGAATDAKYGGDTDLLEIPPIITNLADPEGTWVRVQASIIFDRKAILKPDFIAAEIGEDILGFMRTLSMAQIGGASGLQHLREDLNERASIQSGGAVRELILQTVVVQ